MIDAFRLSVARQEERLAQNDLYPGVDSKEYAKRVFMNSIGASCSRRGWHSPLSLS